ncbi:MAG: hypothetical protein AAGC60_27455 [Acidobacteriota bacterium]
MNETSTAPSPPAAESNTVEIVATVSWLGKYVVLPLTPFIVGVMVRYLYSGNLEFRALSPAELSFSMAMMSLVMATKASQLENSVRGAITTLYRVGVVVFIVLFSIAMFLETDISASYKLTWLLVLDQLNNGMPVTGGELPARVEFFGGIVDRLRSLTVTFSCIFVPLTVFTVRKYNMEEI